MGSDPPPDTVRRPAVLSHHRIERPACMVPKDRIAHRVAQDNVPRTPVNLVIGLPRLVAGFVTAVPGAAAINSAMRFGQNRSVHIVATVLGCWQVDDIGHLVSWKIPGKRVPGMGAAMERGV